jgi:hypothetical protein
LAFVVVMIATTAVGAPSRSPVAISPGAPDATLTVGSSCPTFSWAGVDGVHGYQLEVVELDERGPVEVALVTDLPAGALSWSPPVGHCLQAGVSYSWSVRSVVDGQITHQSEDAYFRVSHHPAPDDVALAYEILSRHREAMQGPTTGAQTTTASIPGATTSGAPEGTGIGFEVEGRVEARDIDIVRVLPFFQGQILADGDIEAQTAAIESLRLTLTENGNIFNRLASFRSDASGRAILCQADGPCEAGSTGADGVLTVRNLFANDGLRVGSGGLTVIRQSSPTGNGGSGYFSVPSATNVNVDNNASQCPSGTIMVGVRLWETDSNQIGVQVKCSAP